MARLALLAAVLPALAAGLTVPSPSPSAELVVPSPSASAEPTSLPAPAPSAVAPKPSSAAAPKTSPTPAAPKPSTPPPPPEAPECVSCPRGAILKGTCYPSLPAAIAASTTNDKITLQGQHNVTAPIVFGHDLSIVGVVCGGKRPSLTGVFANPTMGIFNMNITLYNGNATTIGYILTDPLNDYSLYTDPQPDGWDYIQVLNVSGIDFAPAIKDANKTMYDTDFYDWADENHMAVMKAQPDVYRHCGIRGPDADAFPSNGSIELRVSDCTFTHFNCQKNGSAIYVPRAQALEVDAKSNFHNNIVYDRADVFGGGGAIYIGFVHVDADVHLRGNYSNNKVYFPWINETLPGSEHGEGGAIKIDWMEGHVHIDGNFMSNEAPDGAAIQVMELQAVDPVDSLNVNGYFSGNRAINMGAGARGACLRVLNANASITLNGTFEDNFATERGGVFANNWISMRSQVTFSGEFRNNTSGQRGACFSSISQFNGNITILGSSIFEGNTVLNDTVDPEQETNILWVSKVRVKLGETKWNSEYAVNGQDFVLIGPPGISLGAIDNWLLPDSEDGTTTDAAGANATEAAPAPARPSVPPPPQGHMTTSSGTIFFATKTTDAVILTSTDTSESTAAAAPGEEESATTTSKHHSTTHTLTRTHTRTHTATATSTSTEEDTPTDAATESTSSAENRREAVEWDYLY